MRVLASRWRRVAVCLLVLVLHPVPLRADATSDYRDGYVRFREALMAVTLDAMRRNREGAAASLETAIARWMALEGIPQSAEFRALAGRRRARRIARSYHPVLRNLAKARAHLDVADSAPSAILRAVKRSRRRSDAVGVQLSRLRLPGATLLERRGRSADIHGPRRRIRFRVTARDESGTRCRGKPDVRVSNLFDAVAVDSTSITVNGKSSFAIRTAGEMGVARVEATLCGATGTRYVFNTGPKNDPCGDGKRDPGEECDDGPANSDTAAGACRTDCRRARCGDRMLDAGEACEPGLAGPGCAVGETCVPAGLAKECTCLPPCAVSPPPTTVSVTTRPPSGLCGCAVDTAGQVSCGLPGTNGRDLSCGDLFIGGGLSALVPGRIPDGAELPTTVALCGGTELILQATAPTSGPGSCSAGVDESGTAQCFFGPPLPFPHTVAPLSTCLTNAIRRDVTGSVDTATGEATLTVNLSSRVFLTGTLFDDPGTAEMEACPRCVDPGGLPVDDGVGTCSGGSSAGAACASTNSAGLSIDCQPDDPLLVGTLEIDLDPLTSATVSMSAPAGDLCRFGTCAGGPRDGHDCNGDADCPDGTCTARCVGGEADREPCTHHDDCPAGVCGQAQRGAFGQSAARAVIVSGVPAAPPLVIGDPKPSILATTFCIPRTGSAPVDNVSDLPGPGATSLDLTILLE